MFKFKSCILKFNTVHVSYTITFFIIYMTKLLQSDWFKRSAIISLIALSRSAINDFRDGWEEWEMKTTKSNMAAKFK